MQVRTRTSAWSHVGHAFNSRPHQIKPKVAAVETSKGLNASVRFFVDYAISATVNSVARQQASRARLSLTGSRQGVALNIVVSAGDHSAEDKFVAYSNDMCLFIGSAPQLFVTNHTPRELEHSIYLYVSELLSGQESVTAQIFRENAGAFELPILEGSSEAGPASLKPRTAVSPIV